MVIDEKRQEKKRTLNMNLKHTGDISFTVIFYSAIWNPNFF